MVLTDFSKFSANSLETAVFFAKEYGSSVVVVHLLKSGSTTDSNFKKSSEYKSAKKQMLSFLDKDYLKDFKVDYKIKSDKNFSDLDRWIKKEETDLLIMGSHGTTGIKKFFVGSNTEQVVRNSPVPVLVTKNKPVTSKVNNALLACNFSDEEVSAYKRAKKLMNKLGCNLKLLNVKIPHHGFRSEIERNDIVSKFLKKSGENADKIKEIIFISNNILEDGIIEYATNNNTDLIIMATQGRKGLAHLFKGSASEDVANSSNLPVMTFKI